MQGLESLDLLVGRVTSLSLERLVVIHHHRVHGQLDHLRPGQFEAPDKQLPENPAKGLPGKDSKRPEKPLHGMRRSHLGLGNFKNSRIARVLPQVVEVVEMTAGPIKEEAQHLQKEIFQGDTFAALLKRTELL